MYEGFSDDRLAWAHDYKTPVFHHILFSANQSQQKQWCIANVLLYTFYNTFSNLIFAISAGRSGFSFGLSILFASIIVYLVLRFFLKWW